MTDTSHPSQWKYESPAAEGFHEIITPENSPCKLSWIFRLNLPKGKHFNLQKNGLELNAVLIQGSARIIHKDASSNLKKLDSFYLPGNEPVDVEALDDCVFFIGGSIYEGKGHFFIRKHDISLSLGDIRQIHGEPPYQRDVFMTLAQQDEGSRLICGITSGEEGKWTSWPPHQHTRDLEEVYCFFDIPAPKAAFHFSSRKDGEFEYIHPVSTGDCVVIPEGYHPTCGMPGVKSTYFWVMAAHRPESRRYDLAVNDPHFEY